jgi:hypothetical protein
LIGGQWVPATNQAAGQPGGAPKLTEGQAKDGFNAKRMAGANALLTGLESQNYDAGKAKLIENFGRDAPGPFASPQTRKYNASQLEWADSLLRLTTGAAATKEEIANTIHTYFPQIGDNEEVRRSKALARQRVQQDAFTRAGPGVAGGTAAPSNAFAPPARAAAPARQQPAQRPSLDSIFGN